jgi:hypothetical protein
MALTLHRANRILQKLGFPHIRHAKHCEQACNEDGERLRWVVDRDERQALVVYPTMKAALAAILESHWELFDANVLTEKERRECHDIPSRVAHLIT